MVRRALSADIDAAADIWLNANLEAHPFVPERYWRGNFQAVKEMLRQGELYVCEDGREIQGFVGLDKNYIAGIFVRSGARSRGTGRLLLEFVKGTREKLSLHVYQKNVRAIRFYQREGFVIQSQSVDENTGEKEYVMLWQR